MPSIFCYNLGMISKEEVQHIAKLARLELSEAETEKMQKDLSGILDYFEVLKKAPKVKKITTILAERKENATRKDVAIKKDPGVAGDLVNAAPDKKGNYIKVKQILQ